MTRSWFIGVSGGINGTPLMCQKSANCFGYLSDYISVVSFVLCRNALKLFFNCLGHLSAFINIDTNQPILISHFVPRPYGFLLSFFLDFDDNLNTSHPLLVRTRKLTSPGKHFRPATENDVQKKNEYSLG